jgi:hypothetical protein
MALYPALELSDSLVVFCSEECRDTFIISTTARPCFARGNDRWCPSCGEDLE